MTNDVPNFEVIREYDDNDNLYEIYIQYTNMEVLAPEESNKNNPEWYGLADVESISVAFFAPEGEEPNVGFVNRVLTRNSLHGEDFSIEKGKE